MTQTILRLDASARSEGSASRRGADHVITRLPDARVIQRDLADGIPQISAAYTSGTFKAPEDRTDAERAALALSDELLAELKAADTLLIATPIYNFSIPASLKAWIDQIARKGESFRYTANGPLGLLTGKRAIVLVASGGTKIGSEVDFATPYLRHALKFIGITDVTFIATRGGDDETALADAVSALTPALAA